MHNFLLNSNGRLSESAKHIPELREQISEMKETKATFKLGELDMLGPVYHPYDIELAGAWPVHDLYDSAKGKRYVNPNYVHVRNFTDHIIRCKCGAKLTRNYDDEMNNIRDDSNHAHGCYPHWRLESRMRLSRLRHAEMVRLGWLGWQAPQIGPRFGATKHSCGGWAQEFNTSLQELRDRYRKHSSETYHHVTEVQEKPYEHVCEIYGHAMSTLRKWYRRYHLDHAIV